MLPLLLTAGFVIVVLAAIWSRRGAYRSTWANPSTGYMPDGSSHGAHHHDAHCGHDTGGDCGGDSGGTGD